MLTQPWASCGHGVGATLRFPHVSSWSLGFYWPPYQEVLIHSKSCQKNHCSAQRRDE